MPESTYLNLLCFLLKDEVAGTAVLVAGFVEYSGLNTHSQSACKYCNHTIFSVEIFNSVKTFKRFWESFFSKVKYKDFAICVARYALCLLTVPVSAIIGCKYVDIGKKSEMQ